MANIYENYETEPSVWKEMSYNRSYNNWDFETDDDDNDDYDEFDNGNMATGMELYFVASVFFDGADIIISEEDNQ